MSYDHNLRVDPYADAPIETRGWIDLGKRLRAALPDGTPDVDWLADDLVGWVQAWFEDHDLSFDTHENCVDLGDFQSWLADAPGVP